MRHGERGVPWSDAEVAVIVMNPAMTAGELSELLPGRSVRAIREKRKRVGRWRMAGRICVACDSRPVYAESAQAREWGLCKRCYLDERELRLAEERRNAAIRQRERTWRNGRQSAESAPIKGKRGETGGIA